MTWIVDFHPDFAEETLAFSSDVLMELDGAIRLLEAVGPALGRPKADTLSGSKMKNLKELRFTADGGVWRIAYAFDPRRKGILLCGGDKSGVASRRFYKGLIALAEKRYTQHLEATT